MNPKRFCHIQRSIKLLVLSVTDVGKGDIVPVTLYIIYDSNALAQKLTSRTELTGSHNVRNVLQHIELNISLTKLRLPLVTSESTSLRKTVIRPETISHRNKVIPSKVNPLLASANPHLVRIERNKSRSRKCEQ